MDQSDWQKRETIEKQGRQNSPLKIRGTMRMETPTPKASRNTQYQRKKPAKIFIGIARANAS
jgi:hypothetical protein